MRFWHMRILQLLSQGRQVTGEPGGAVSPWWEPTLPNAFQRRMQPCVASEFRHSMCCLMFMWIWDSGSPAASFRHSPPLPPPRVIWFWRYQKILQWNPAEMEVQGDLPPYLAEEACAVLLCCCAAFSQLNWKEPVVTSDWLPSKPPHKHCLEDCSSDFMLKCWVLTSPRPSPFSEVKSTKSLKTLEFSFSFLKLQGFSKDYCFSSVLQHQNFIPVTRLHSLDFLEFSES